MVGHRIELLIGEATKHGQRAAALGFPNFLGRPTPIRNRPRGCGCDWRLRANVWRKITSPTRRAKRLKNCQIRVDPAGNRTAYPSRCPPWRSRATIDEGQCSLCFAIDEIVASLAAPDERNPTRDN